MQIVFRTDLQGLRIEVVSRWPVTGRKGRTGLLKEPNGERSDSNLSVIDAGSGRMARLFILVVGPG